QQHFMLRLPEIAAAQVPVLLRQGRLAEAARIANRHPLPLSQARVLLAQGDPAGAVALLEPLAAQMEARGWADERLRALVLAALALDARGDEAQALQRLDDALALAEPGGYIRLFLDEGPAMARLLARAGAQDALPDYLAQLLAAFEAEQPASL